MNSISVGVWAVLLVSMPLALALIAYVFGRRVRPLLVWIAPAAMVACVVGIVDALMTHGPSVYQVGGWAPPLGITWRIDGLCVAMLSVTTLTIGLVCVYAAKYFSDAEDESGSVGSDLFWPLVFFLWSALNALFLSADVFNVYVTLELLTLASVGFIALSGTPQALAAALRYLVLGLLASLLYLMGVALLYGTYGTLDMGTIADQLTPNLPTWTAAGLLLAGLIIKTALFPLHFWLPPAHGAAPAPASALLSALVVKASFYLVLRYWFDVFDVSTVVAGQLLGSLGAGAIVWGSVLALRAERLKNLIAYSTVAQLGYLFLVFPMSSSPDVAKTAWLGVVLFALSHSLAKASMFLAAGRIAQLGNGDRLDAMTGVGRQAPLAVTATALAGVSLMGLPPSGGFAGKWMLLVAGVKSGQWWWALVIVLGGLLTAAYLFRFWRVAIAASDSGTDSAVRTNWQLELPAVALGAAAMLLLFFTPQIVELLELQAADSSNTLAEAIP